MTKRVIREDDQGAFVLTGGYAFRPPVDSNVMVGAKVNATHIGGTMTAKVADEIWFSNSDDPQYIKYAIQLGYARCVNCGCVAWQHQPEKYPGATDKRVFERACKNPEYV